MAGATSDLRSDERGTSDERATSDGSDGLGKKFANVPILQGNVKITFIRAKLVTEGVPRVPTL